MGIEERDLGGFALPLPEEIRQWSPVPVLGNGKYVPFGYEPSEDGKMFLPIREDLEALEVARKHLRQYSYKDVAHWLSRKTGKNITPEQLRQRIKREQSRANRAKAYRRLARRAIKYLQQAKEWEEKVANLHPQLEKTNAVVVPIPEYDEDWLASNLDSIIRAPK